MRSVFQSLSTGFRIYLRAQAAYALITLPSLLLPYLYFMSELLALIWGTAALLMFLPVLPIIRAAGLRIKIVIVCLMLIAGLAATYWAVWKACNSMRENKSVLEAMLEWWPFPAIAFISVIYAVLREHKALGSTSISKAEPTERLSSASLTNSYYPPA